MRSLLPWLLVCLPGLMVASVIGDVRAAIARKDFAAGEKFLREYRSASGVTPEFLEALSWMGRGALAERQFDKAEAFAAETYKLCVEQLRTRPLDAERRLPTALGAAIEVHAQLMAARGERGEAVQYLSAELEKYRATSIRIRIQKNIHLLGLGGKAGSSDRGR